MTFESKQGPDFDGVRWTNHGTIFHVPAMDRIGERAYSYKYGASRKALRPIVVGESPDSTTSERASTGRSRA